MSDTKPSEYHDLRTFPLADVVMSLADLVARLQQQFPDCIRLAPDGSAIVIPTELPVVCRFLRDDPAMRFEILNDVSGVDYFEADPKKSAKAGFEPHLEVVYHLSSFSFPGRRLTIRVELPRWADEANQVLPELPTVSDIWRTADWQEREVYDLLGVRFIGHPDLRRILLAEDWVGHPLRKDYEFPLEYHGIRCR